MPGVVVGMDPPQAQPNIKHEDSESNNDDEFAFEAGDIDNESYKPRPQLAEPVVLKRTLGQLMDSLEEGSIDVDPDYQREVVWTADRMTGLVNSLMENYYIPPIILNMKKRSNPNGNGQALTYVCVDGKQRLSSVRAFVKGMIPCHDYRGEKWYFSSAGVGARSKRKVLSEEMRRRFLAKEFVSFEFPGLSQNQEEDLFARVQMGVSLTLAEKMHAQSGPWQELARQFVQDFPAVTSLLRDTAREKDFQMILACFSQILEVQHPTAANGVPGLRTKTLPQFIRNAAALDDDTRSHLANVFRVYNNLVNLDPEVFRNTERKLKGVQTFAPIELVSIAVLISMYSDTRNEKLLLGDIRYLRILLRDQFKDLRLNVAVWKFVWDYIDNLEQVRGVVNVTTDATGSTVARPVSSEAIAVPSTPRPSTISPSAARRRSRGTRTDVSVAGPSTTAPSPRESRPSKRPRFEEPEPVQMDSTIKPEPGSSTPAISSNAYQSNVNEASTGAPSRAASQAFNPMTGLKALQQGFAQTRIGTAPIAAPVLSPTLPSSQRRPASVNTPCMQGPASKPNSGPSAPPKSNLLSPAQLRQERVSMLNEFRAPIANMSSPATTPKLPHVPLPRAPPGQSKFAIEKPPRFCEPFTAAHRPATKRPPVQAADARTPVPDAGTFAPFVPKSAPATPQSRDVPPAPASGSVIDLTDDAEESIDTEEERRKMMASFRGRSTNHRAVTDPRLRAVPGNAKS